MKNREKYAKELLDIACESRVIAVKNGVPCECNGITCRECDLSDDGGCDKNFTKWCNSEYGEPPTDWSKVPVDTPILIRDSGDGTWYKRHFAKYEDGKVYAFCDGQTSWSGNSPVCWEQAKLATDDELNANSILRADGREGK